MKLILWRNSLRKSKEKSYDRNLKKIMSRKITRKHLNSQKSILKFFKAGNMNLICKMLRNHNDLNVIDLHWFELIFIIKNNKQTITIFHEFLDFLINKVIENNLSNLYKMFKLTNLWHKVDKVVKVYNKFKKVKGLSTNIRIWLFNNLK